MLKRFLALFLPLAIVFLAAFWYVQHTTMRSNRAIIEAGEARILALQAQTARRALQDLVTDLQILANKPDLHRYLAHHDPEALNQVELEFLNFSSHKKRYDQIRLLDVHGMEVARVNFSRDAGAEIVPKNQLQPKRDRYYFTETINLAPGNIFISPLDLNIEHGAIEKPFKPMIRLAMPVFDAAGRKGGVVILNYMAQKLLESMESAGNELLGEFALLNDEGYWLASVDQDQEWGFMYPERRNLTFAQDFPEAWQLMQSTNSGQFQLASGLFTYTTVFPHAIGGRLGLDATTVLAVDGSPADTRRQHRWLIVSHISGDVLWTQLYSPIGFIIVFSLAGLALLAALSAVVARAHKRRRQAIEVLRQSQAELENQLRFNQTLIDSIPAPVFFKDIEGRYLGCNAAYEAFIGLSAGQLIGKSVYDIAPHDLADIYFQQDQALFDQPGQQIYESAVVFADGSRHDVIFHKNTFTNHQGELSGLIGVMLDITERKRMEEQIKYMAQHDALTGLPNRNLLEDRYRQCIHRAERGQRAFAVLMMDLDGFKTVNDSLGHKVGDEVLQEVARRLELCVRKTDTLCRMGGDEFVVLLEALNERKDVMRVAETIRQALNEPFILGQEQIARIGVSIGIVVSSAHEETLDMLLARADVAMYRAKRDGRSRSEFYSAGAALEA